MRFAVRLAPLLSTMALALTPGATAIATADDSAGVSATADAAPSAGTFVAQFGGYYNQPLVLEKFSLTDGRPMAVAATLPQWPSHVSGPYRAKDGSLWLAVTTGPTCSTDTMECAFAPDSCSGQIVRIDPKTWDARTVFRAPPTRLIGDPVPSPDGRSVAFVAQPCDGFWNGWLDVLNVNTGRVAAIGNPLPPCHLQWPPAWSSDSGRLVFSYGPSTGPGRRTLFGQSCEGLPVGRLAVMPARRAHAVTTRLAKAERACGYTASAFVAGGVLAIKTCGPNQLGPAYLVQFDRKLHQIRRFTLPPGADPDTMAVNQSSGGVLITTYQVPQYTGTPLPATYVFVFAHERLRLVKRYATMDDGVPAYAGW